jgi:SAM-dependent methyltransferase
VSPSALEQDAVNRDTWRLPGTVHEYERLQGWTDPGERAAVGHVCAEMRGQPILDIGVGAGRTTPLLRAVSDDYLGIDYTEEMVRACRARHPGARIEPMDARDLGRLESGRFALAMFSFNGIDAVNVEQRAQVLREVHRVLRPGGVFIVSAHNRNGPGHGERPGLHLDWSWNPLKLGWRTVKLARSLPRSLRNSRRLRALNETHEDWSIRNCGAHDFGIVVVYTTMAEQKRQLAAAGFDVELVLDNVAGRPVADDADTSGAWWFHYIARKA